MIVGLCAHEHRTLGGQKTLGALELKVQAEGGSDLSTGDRLPSPAQVVCALRHGALPPALHCRCLATSESKT